MIQGKTKERILYTLNIFFGTFGICVFLVQCLNFVAPQINGQLPPVCIAENMFTWLSNFSYFTYLTMLTFSLWLIVGSLGYFLRNNTLKKIYSNKLIVTFVFTNYLITTIVYTLFELSKPVKNFGLYNHAFNGRLNFTLNITAHYTLFLYCLFSFINVKVSQCKNEKLGLILMSAYMFIYLVAVKFIGEFCYPVEWYPYPVFDVQSLFQMFGLTVSENVYFEAIILCSGLIAVTISYYFLLKFVMKFKTKTQRALLIYVEKKGSIMEGELI